MCLTAAMLLPLLLCSLEQIAASPTWPLENVDALYYTATTVTTGNVENGTGTGTYRMSFKAPSPHCSARVMLTGQNIIHVSGKDTESIYGTISVADPSSGKTTIISLTNATVPGPHPIHIEKCTTHATATNQSMCINPFVEVGKRAKWSGVEPCGDQTCDAWTTGPQQQEQWLFIQGTQKAYSSTIKLLTGTTVKTIFKEWKVNGQVDVSPSSFAKPSAWGKCDDPQIN